MNASLQDKVQNSQCSHFAQNEMMEAIRLAMVGKGESGEEVIEIIDDKKRNSPLVAGCFTICGFGPED